ncbi:hypothetical protein ZWY2020_029059 [Hordeum vulgare]|nr:hypothetical protein ZWY2020_029059 [Hordeum vulgare]
MVDFPGFEAHPVDLPDAAEMPHHADSGERLRGAEIRFRSEEQGPESIARARAGRHTGVDGRLLEKIGALPYVPAAHNHQDQDVRIERRPPDAFEASVLYPLGSPGFSTDRVPPNTTTNCGAIDPSSYSDDDGEAEVDPNVHPEDDGTTVLLDEEEDDGKTSSTTTTSIYQIQYLICPVPFDELVVRKGFVDQFSAVQMNSICAVTYTN